MTVDVDYQLAFNLAPVGLVLSRHRTMVDCNQAVCDMFGATNQQFGGPEFSDSVPQCR